MEWSAGQPETLAPADSRLAIAGFLCLYDANGNASGKHSEHTPCVASGRNGDGTPYGPTSSIVRPHHAHWRGTSLHRARFELSIG